MLTGKEVRQKFLTYFEERGHKVLSSSSLVPQKDPTLLFTNAGMVQFKSIFLGDEVRDYKRATTVQKCVRAGGKHNDLEVVGKTNRHHTFFEMLGNFSFGDYFKEQAIEFGWELLTDVLKLSKDRLWVTVYKDDDEAHKLWATKMGVPESRIVAMGEKDNFWQMGDTGPCGPCSEIIIDQGPGTGCGKPDCALGCDCDRYLELWNLVFMQFNRSQDGILTPLPKPSIDTGMGLERVTAILQGVGSNFDTDLFKPLIESVCSIAGCKYAVDPVNDVSIRVIIDHARAATFLISDGVLPSNEGRGYVLRRILRRALRHGKMLGIERQFFSELCLGVIDFMSDPYTELLSAKSSITGVVQNEEKKFAATLTQGLEMLHSLIEELRGKSRDINRFPGEMAFKLYDTYGFPIDLTAEILKDFQIDIDYEDFARHMETQKSMARRSRDTKIGESSQEAVRKLLEGVKETHFLGYEKNIADASVTKIIKDGKTVKSVNKGDKADIVLDATTFYGESGGQVGDTGTIFSNGTLFTVTGAIKPFGGIIIHQGTVTEGSLSEGMKVTCSIDEERRSSIRLNHTSTHILHSALKQIIGSHVNQAGSLVAPDRFRFDFTHFSRLEDDELDQIEELVNKVIRENIPVKTDIMKIEDAIKEGATALFDEKYSDTVRVVKVNSFSRELCGGTHINATGDIGFFKIISEKAVASGVRRIEGCTGKEAFLLVKNMEKKIDNIAGILKTGNENVLEKIGKLLETQKKLEREIESLRASGSKQSVAGFADMKREINGIQVITGKIPCSSIQEQRTLTEEALRKIGSGIVVSGADFDGKVSIIGAVSKDLTGRFSASDMVKNIAPIIDGSGGGRADFAQAGGKNAAALDSALNKIYEIIENKK